MINISQTGAYNLDQAATKYNAEYVISITEKGGKAPPTPEGIDKDKHYVGYFDDYYKDVKFSAYRTPPTREDIEKVLTFVKSIKNPRAELFIHCSAGISRSAALAIGIYYMLMGAREDKAEEAIMLALESHIGEKANFWPSNYIVEILDDIFGNKNRALSKKLAEFKSLAKPILAGKN